LVFDLADAAVMSVGVSSMGELGPAIIADKQSVVLSWIAGDDEVGFVIKAAIALAAKPEAVLTPFHREGCNFITSSIVFFVVVTGENSLWSLGPVVRSSSSRLLFVRGCLSQGAVIWVKEEKAFQFFPIDSVNRRIIKNVEIEKYVRCHMSKKNIHRLYFVFW
jgi:hypothetical protein